MSYVGMYSYDVAIYLKTQHIFTGEAPAAMQHGSSNAPGLELRVLVFTTILGLLSDR